MNTVRRQRIATVAMMTNPVSGRGGAKRAAEQATRRLLERGITVTAITGGSAEATAAQLAGALDRNPPDAPDAVVAVGGDGTVSLALQQLATGPVPLGIIPAGTGNDHARQYGIPTGNPRAAADVIADGWAHTVDLGCIQTSGGSVKWFGTVAATGFDSLVSDRANRMRWPRGRMRYNLAMLAELSRLRLLPFRLSFDDGAELTTGLTMAAFGNTRSYGGGMLICPDADPTDGLLDITMVHSASRARLIRLFPTVFEGTHVDLAEVRTARARSVLVDSPGINAYADGDYVCALPVQISAVSAALQILRPIAPPGA